MQPGDVVGPGSNAPETEKPAEQQVASPVQPASTQPQSPVETHADEPKEPEANWEFSAQDDNNPAPDATRSQESVSWTASEYIAHEKNGGWYVLLSLAVIAFSAIVYFITGELISAVVIVIMGAAFGSFAARKPQELTYILDSRGLKIGEKPYPYTQFKSFTVIDEGAISSITLMPLQRFMPPLSIYYDPSDEDKITDALSAYLPYEDRKQDAVDRLMRRVRF